MADYQPVAPENTSELVICPQCSALVLDRRTSKEHHAAWHDALADATTGQPDDGT